ncbi:unnamed protein product [Ostreobium quekettii]|uniref:Peptidase M24 domain-containing protein n=1 Tax=Ostreobium quekettii TaxID=121088 RepID=A0A8S1ILS0_9CHLO|nr:unnamed protein product [Ostreobium quekettii]|eukprot:evm.model.scf_237.6 EVM.evm.TU.scf_237.6   scf_237:39938-41785(+)
MSSVDSDAEEPELDLSNSDVVTKYKAAADICNRALAAVVAECVDGRSIVELCNRGNTMMDELVSKVFKGKDVEKGVAFPTCISVNNCAGHFCPLESDAAVKNGDVVKIDLGCHIDGFIAVQAHTIVVQPDPKVPITGRAADVIAAAQTCFEAALRLVRPGKSVAEVPGPLQAIAESFGCNLLEGVMSHQLKRFVIDGNKCVLNRPSPEARVEDGEFEVNEVYAIDIVVSTGDGKARILDEKETTIYKRALDMEYHLKMKASRTVFGEINKRFPTMPFTVGALSDPRTMRLGLVECLNHGLLHPYPVMYERNGELVAQVKATVLLMPNGSDRVTVAPQQVVQSEKKVEDPEVLELLKSGYKTKKKKKGGKKGGGEEGAGQASAATTSGA